MKIENFLYINSWKNKLFYDGDSCDPFTVDS